MSIRDLLQSVLARQVAPTPPTPETEERALRIARQALRCEPVTVQFLSSRQMAKRP